MQCRGPRMAVKDLLPPGVVGTERKLKAGQALFRLGSRTAGLYK